jgi:hypothetical protein
MIPSCVPQESRQATPGGFLFMENQMKTYRVEYRVNGEWIPGNLVQMKPSHLKWYLEFLAGDRPLVSFDKANGRLVANKIVHRVKKKCLPTRVRCVEPVWIDEDGYYLFDGTNLEFISLAELDGQRIPFPKNHQA